MGNGVIKIVIPLTNSLRHPYGVDNLLQVDKYSKLLTINLVVLINCLIVVLK
ncbi:hypothetical protein D3C87_1801950 [compost metagenome]